MRVFVKNLRGENLMPCSNRKARLLLKEKKAKIVGYKPFTIQLLIPTGEVKQDVSLGVDIGSKHVGVAITSVNRVLMKGQINLRQDVKRLLETRKILRRGRRNRKTRYRESKFLNRIASKKDGWLPPTIKSRINNIIFWVNKFYGLLPNCKLCIEIAKFDIQKIENPEISGKGYQQGNLYEYCNRIAYLLQEKIVNVNYVKKVMKKIMAGDCITFGGNKKIDRKIGHCYIKIVIWSYMRNI